MHQIKCVEYLFYCQAQSQLQVKLILKTELALISLNPAPHPTHPGKFIFQHFSVNVDQVSSHELEDDLTFLANGRRPQSFGKWKTTSIFLKMEDDLKYTGNGN